MQQKPSRNLSADLSASWRSLSPSLNSSSFNASNGWKKSKLRLLPFVTPPRQSQTQTPPRNSQRQLSLLASTKAIVNRKSSSSSQLAPSIPAAMSDFLERENEVLGGEFTSNSEFSSGLGNNNNDIDFDRAASAFPDINLDGTGDIPTPQVPIKKPSNTFSFDDFIDSKPTPNVRVTGDDEIEKFEDQFPDIETTTVSCIA